MKSDTSYLTWLIHEQSNKIRELERRIEALENDRTPTVRADS